MNTLFIVICKLEAVVQRLCFLDYKPTTEGHGVDSQSTLTLLKSYTLELLVLAHKYKMILINLYKKSFEILRGI